MLEIPNNNWRKKKTIKKKKNILSLSNPVISRNQTYEVAKQIFPG